MTQLTIDELHKLLSSQIKTARLDGNQILSLNYVGLNSLQLEVLQKHHYKYVFSNNLIIRRGNYILVLLFEYCPKFLITIND